MVFMNWFWYLAFLQVNDKCSLQPISLSTLSKIRNNYVKHYVMKMVGDNLLIMKSVISFQPLIFNM